MAILVDSSATDSNKASCFMRLPDVGISVERERYGEMSAVLALRLDDGGFETDSDEDVADVVDAVERVAEGGELYGGGTGPPNVRFSVPLLDE